MDESKEKIIVKTIIVQLVIIFIGMMLIACIQKAGENPIEKPSTRIKSIMESVHDPIENGGELESQSTIREGSSMIKFSFSPKGVLLAKSTFDSKGNLEGKTIYKYSAAGDTLETLRYSFNESLISRWINKFDLQHRLVESREVNESGKTIGQKIVEENNSNTTNVITYSQVRGNLVKIMESHVDEINRSAKKFYFSNEKMIREDSISYDDRGNRIETNQFFPLKMKKRITQFKYDSLNNIIEQVVLNDNLMITDRIVSNYDKNNNVIETLTYGVMGKLEKRLSHTYQYNEASHWTKRITFKNGKPALITIHRIEYY